MKRLVVTLYIFAVVSSVIFAQNIQRFEYYGSENGLSQNNAYSVTCDKNGFLWVGTMNGLNRFDGKSFKYFHDYSHAHSHRVERMWTDKADYIWAETYDGTYEYLDQRHEEFNVIPFNSTNDAATAFVQYSDSLIFVGTEQSGLYALNLQNDGRYSVTQYSIDGKCINGLFISSDFTLWVMTNSGVARLSNYMIMSCSDWTVKLEQESVGFTGAVAEIDDNIFLGTKGHGIMQYDLQWRQDELSKSTVSHLLPVNDNQLFVATAESSAFIYNIDNQSKIPVNYHGTGVSDVAELYLDKSRQLWVTTSQPGVTRVDLNTLSSKYYQLVPQEIAPTVDLERPYFIEDRDNTLWIGLHGGGLLMFDRHADSFISYRNDVADSGSIPSDVVHCITMDNAGQLWLGTGQYRGGLVKVVTRNTALRDITPIERPRSQVDNVVRAVLEDSAHNIWVSTKSGKSFVYDGNGNVKRVFNGFETVSGSTFHSLVYDMIVDNRGRLWVATKGLGLFVSDSPVDFDNIGTARIRFRQFSTSTSPSLANNNVYSITEDYDDNIWVATYGGGLTRLMLDENGVVSKSRTFNEDNCNILSDKVRSVMVDHTGNLWVATTNGVCRAKAGVLSDSSVKFDCFTHDSNDNSLSYNDVCHIYEGADGDIYLSTIGGGLDVLSITPDGSKSYTHYTMENGLCNNAIYGVAQAEDGSVWVATENGLARIDRKHNVVDHYNDDSGLRFNAFSESTVCRLSDNRIVMGGYKGVVIISPENLISDAHKSHLVFTKLLIGGQEVNVSSDVNAALSESVLYADKIYLNPSQNAFALEYTTLDYSNQNRVNYSYRLLGLEDEWHNVGSESTLSYTNIQPGNYTLEVRYSYGAGGEWFPDIKRIKVKVDAPWYKSMWAYLLYTVVLVSLIYTIIRGISRINHYRHELRLEKRLNDVKLQFFTNIAHEIRTPLTLIVAPIESLSKRNDLPLDVQRDLNVVQRSTNRLLLLINQLLDFRKVQNKQMNLQVAQLDLGQLVHDVSDSFRLLAEHKHIAFQVDIPALLSPVWADAKEMDTVVYNILSNAMKFTDEGKSVTVIVSQDADNSYISVADQGCGMTEVEQQHLFKRYSILSTNALSGTGIGLSLAYELVKLHGGDISVDSVKGNGSTFVVRIPNGKSHFDKKHYVSFVDGVATIPHHAEMPSVSEFDYEADDSEPSQKDRKSVLIVEDNTEIIDYLSQALSSDYRCSKAANGNEALILIESEHPDVVITDLMMPVMDGLTMIRNLKDNFETSHIPVVALTAKSSMEDQIETLKLGIDAFIPKPFNIEHIKVVISNILARREEIAARIVGLSNMTDELKNYDEAETSPSLHKDIPGSSSSAQENTNDLSYITIQSKDEKFLEELVHFTEEKYKEDLTIDDFASHFYMSRTVFYNKVKGLTGSSPLEFVRQIKFKIAAELLKKGYNVSEVAFEIGYSDVKYFSRQFKAQFGYAPSQVKKS